MKLIEGKDNLIRTTEIRTLNGKTLLRPISHLFPLEVSEDRENPTVDQAENASDGNDDSLTAEPPQRVTRSQTEKVRSKTPKNTAQASFALAPSSIPFYFSVLFFVLLKIVGSARESFSVQLCPYRHSGVFMKIPTRQTVHLSSETMLRFGRSQSMCPP